MLYLITSLSDNIRNLTTETTKMPAPNMMSDDFSIDIEAGEFVEYADDGFDLESQMSISTNESRPLSPWSVEDVIVNTSPRTPRNTNAEDGDEEIVWTADPYPVNLWTPPITNTYELTTPPRLIRMTNDNHINMITPIAPRNLTEEFMTM